VIKEMHISAESPSTAAQGTSAHYTHDLNICDIATM